ncbi:hypothetical protein A2865_00765 [Candidatus Woesebacteria bacterium RIFCSPHIGHO2_01_FULL_39_17]|uniref:Uncharacterized protein n=4 Tax=Microgenomates group TaxID=1794810 RepID=A0A0H4TAJ9_9BACT|nr:hypothetical protein [uncultured Microgenomates bacterium Rifle_16ft_4_minimus_954]KKQ51924.1 MAG: hypothetical protein US72_C0011G0023 [Microgenomates group bacterium GW2011_GWC1_38_12]KKQ94412.1 MAG: hypothetical protein UT19_C0002G0054 [Candidatus Woesebacteria bacterium GW2011_GWB1_39_10b]KKR14424.1 MAG: hypothetical protein UT40_C0001G0054 [Candidatus Woesebacteria bacterium GW2011_GWA1_39_21b]OGM23779.1 MAG: hypothetical protein A2865_00765 [Candidatus Woesebacteria bacterium RIFCSPHIG
MVKIIIDPVKLGNLEVGWWRAHHEGDKGKLLELLVEYNVNFYGFSQDEAKDAIGDLIQGVKYHDTREWAKAIDSVSKFYLRVKEKTELSFDPEEIAGLEVGWWKLHDDLENNPDKSKLGEAFAKLYAVQFGVEEEKLTKAGRLKAEATRQHDIAEEPSTPTREIEKHWKKANQLLVNFHSELKRVLS